MNTEVQPSYQLAIQEAKHRFQELSGGHLNYGDEEIFAMQMLTKNDYVFKVANDYPYSVQLAMINVASTGLTLNPAMGYAYLVPRDGEIKLDISYKGLIKIATDTGSIVWARAECVYENDQFTYLGPAAMPEVKADPFRDRGEIIGAYCVAKTVDGDILTEVMDRAAIEVIRGKSTSYTRGKDGQKGPWVDFFSEMCRKAVIKRARKTWPYTDRSGRLAVAVDLANEAEGGYTFEKEQIGRPTDGAWEAMDPETQKELLKLAAKVTDIIDSEEDRSKEDKELDAYKAIEKAELGSEEKIALWTQLGSSVRSGLKRAAERQKAVAK